MTLKKEDNPPTCFPVDLFTREEEDSEKLWRVARTKSRQEKAVARDFIYRKIDYFLPLISKPQKQKNRMRTSIVPIFNGYIFFKGTDKDRYEALTTGRIAQILEVPDQCGFVNELKSLAKVTEKQINLKLCDFVDSGQRVQIIDGPMAGIEGIVEKRKNQNRLILQVKVIRQAASVEINLDQVRPF